MSHSSKNWQVIYRHKDSLAGCFVWAPDEAQAEKKFKARKEWKVKDSGITHHEYIEEERRQK